MARAEHKGEIREQFEDVRNELQKLAGEIRLKIHLAGMDAKDTWNRLEPKIHEVEQRAERATEKVGHELQDMAQDLRARLRRLREEL